MIILAFPYGNHSNRLFQNLHFEAFCKEYSIDYINPSFSDMYDYYVSPCNLFKSLKYKFYKEYGFILRMMGKLKISRIEKSVKIFNAENENNLNALLSNIPHNMYVGGWYFRVHGLTEKYQDYFIEKYTLKEKYIKNNELYNKVLELKENNIVIGVHIRRGDYKYWQDGKYNFDENIYREYMCGLENKIKHTYNKNCFFIIFSNADALALRLS